MMQSLRASFLRLLRRWQFPAFLLLSVMPVFLAWLCINAPDALPSAYILFAAYTLLSGVCLAVPGRFRLTAGVVSCALLVALSFFVLAVQAYPPFLLLPAGLGALLLYALPLAARRFESEVPPYLYVAGIGIHVVFQFLHHYFIKTGGLSPYEPAAGVLTASLIGYIVLLLLSMNRISLDNATLARHRLPAGMRGLNTALTLLFAALSLALALMPAVIRGITFLWHTLANTLTRILAFLLSLLPAAEDPGMGTAGNSEPMLPGMLEIAEPSALAVLLEKIAYVLSMLFLIVGTVFLLCMLGRLLVRFAKKLVARLREYTSAASAEYEDEITDTREDGAQRETRFLRRGPRRSAQYSNTPAGRIRQIYARLMRRNAEWTQSSTARENLPESAAALYERARYSDHAVTAEDADRFSRDVRRL
ncbi:MAG: hypothetical protein IKU34_06175 [Clostridia bacterium]|nr:hypothetical protein [Clostridia bacterium]